MKPHVIVFSLCVCVCVCTFTSMFVIFFFYSFAVGIVLQSEDIMADFHCFEQTVKQLFKGLKLNV